MFLKWEKWSIQYGVARTHLRGRIGGVFTKELEKYKDNTEMASLWKGFEELGDTSKEARWTENIVREKI